MPFIATNKKPDPLLRFLYDTVPGRVLLKALCCRAVSKVCGAWMDSPLSRPMIGRFARKHQIAMEDYHCEQLRCFNDFFSREIRAGLRPIAPEPDTLIAPCDGLLSVYPIEEGTVIPIKQSRYTISDLLGADPVAQRYQGGICAVFRLCVNHYHRYCYLDDVQKGENVFLPGQLHTVRPIALERLPVFVRNCRAYTVMESACFGAVTQVEVGAMLVGKIQNHHGAGRFARGQEKGMFLYGGSTIVVLLEPGRAALSAEFYRNTEQGLETPVQMGQPIGRATAPPGQTPTA